VSHTRDVAGSVTVRSAFVVLGAAVLSIVVVLGTPSTASAATNARALPRDGVRREVGRLVHTTYPNLAFGNVACPEAVAKRAGTKFACTVQLPGAFLVVDGTVSSGDGTVSLAAAQAVIPKAQLEQFVGANTSLPAIVDCGAAPFHVARPNQVVTCRASLADGTVRTVELTVADTAGTVTITGVS
jgi:hypothetical protein